MTFVGHIDEVIYVTAIAADELIPGPFLTVNTRLKRVMSSARVSIAGLYGNGENQARVIINCQAYLLTLYQITVALGCGVEGVAIRQCRACRPGAACLDEEAPTAP